MNIKPISARSILIDAAKFWTIKRKFVIFNTWTLFSNHFGHKRLVRKTSLEKINKSKKSNYTKEILNWNYLSKAITLQP